MSDTRKLIKNYGSSEMSHTTLTEKEMTRFGESRDVGRERMKTERERAALQMQRERRRRQPQASAAQPGHIPSKVNCGAISS
jgi:hypothetical protein